MRFYSKITRKPNSVIKQIKEGDKILSQKRLCVFVDGVCDTDDPKVIEELKKHPDKFSDKPFPKKLDWKATEEGQQLMEKGKELGIDMELGNNYKNIRKEYLEKLIKEKGGKVVAKLVKYQEVVSKAKELGIDTYHRKKDELLKEIREKEVIKS
ncbi:MAG: hypothetical protein GX126_10870 [Bacteroidales bacterium]|jgi:triphosphoribosyl-dephospho-CoA synthetase|nr:hypothetical protein [Bacteroidales bacterium]